MNLQPGPSQSIVKLPRLYRTTISASLPLTLLLSLPSTSSFLTIRIPHETLRHNGVAGGRTNRPAELTTLHFYISMQNGGKKKQEKSPACEFFHFSLRQPTFLLENFCITINFIEYHECITRLEIKPLEICKFLTLKAMTVCKTTIFVGC